MSQVQSSPDGRTPASSVLPERAENPRDGRGGGIFGPTKGIRKVTAPGLSRGWHGGAGRGSARRGRARHGMAGRGPLWGNGLGLERPGEAGPGQARRGPARRGTARHGKAWQGPLWGISQREEIKCVTRSS